MGKGKKKPNNDKKRKNDLRNKRTETKERSPQTEKDDVADKTEIADQADTNAETVTALSVSEDQLNVEKVFFTLHVTPDKAVEPVVAPEQLLYAEHSEQESEDEIEDGEYVEVNDVVEADGVPLEVQTQEMSEQAVTSGQSSRASSEKLEKEKTVCLWEKKDEEVTLARAQLIRDYYGKFVNFLNTIDPEFRFAAGIGPCETFDAESFDALLSKFEEKNFKYAWPFNDDLRVTAEELRLLYTDIMDNVKFCLNLACAERGYDFKITKKICSISSVWGEQIDPVLELKTIEVIIRKMKTFIDKLGVECDESSRFWTDFDECFEVILPALEASDSEKLASKCISDLLSSLHGRKNHGFEISEEEVDQMLETSFATDGFGDFPMTVLYCPSVFTTVRQLKLIVPQLKKMSDVIDIRVKLAGVQAITQIFHGLSSEMVTELFEDLRNEPKITMRKMFGLDPETFEVIKNRQVKRVDYFKVFYTVLGEKVEEESHFSDEQIASALLGFYLVFPAYEVNSFLFRILVSKQSDSVCLDNDRETIIRALLKLPRTIREWIEVGEEFSTGEITENQESMYYQVKCAVEKRKLEAEQLNNVLSACVENPLISVERVMRMCMKFIEIGVNQQISVATLTLLRRSQYKMMNIPAKFFEDLLLLALSKYSLPDEKSSESKFNFLDTAFCIVNEFKKETSLEFDEKAIMERWMNLGHHWFSMMYLSCKFPVLKLSTLEIKCPWHSADVWDGEDTSSADPKKYNVLAKVSLAWPDCTSMDIIQDLIRDHVPHEVNRCELYKSMREYISGLDLVSYWKKSLLRKYDEKISFLTTQKSQARKSEKSSNEGEEDEDNAENSDLEITCHEDNQPPVEESSDVPDTDEVEDLEKTESSSETSEDVESLVADEQQTDEQEESDQHEKENIEMISREEQKENQAKQKLVDLTERTDFIRYYDADTWSGFPAPVREEVLKQRKHLGY